MNLITCTLETKKVSICLDILHTPPYIHTYTFTLLLHNDIHFLHELSISRKAVHLFCNNLRYTLLTALEGV